MCGICGIVGERNPDLLRRMMEALRHRGPDDEGAREGDVASLGFRRLSIIDLAGGHQPLSNEAGDAWLVFNGEIYNFVALRAELEGLGHRFATKTDSEVVIHGYEQWGAEVVTHLDGMFAFAVWDGRDRSLLLARDRVGKKPLWYRHDGERLYFASEGKALLQADLQRHVDPVSLELFLAYNHVPAPRSMFAGISKLQPAHWLRFRAGRVETQRYWEPAVASVTTTMEADADRAFHALGEAVKKRLMADVPLGAFLSGGIDSSVIVGLMALISRAPVKTFSVGFEEEEFSELEHARTVARHFRTEHQEFVVKADAAAILPKLAWQYDEPFGDSSAVPTYYVSQITAKHVKVALSGDGGDEVFGGYVRYDAVAKAAKLQRTPLGTLAARMAAPFAGGKHGRRKKRLIGMLDLPLATIYRDIMSAFGDDRIERLLESRHHAEVVRHLEEPFGRVEDPVVAAAYTDLLTYLPGDLLVKVDIASMANSLEVRCPFLDPAVVAAGMALPGARRSGKAVLKRAFRALLPAAILDRPKQGFAMPVAAWLRGPLKTLMEDLLLDKRARERGFFSPEGVAGLVSEHLSGAADHQDRLWLLLVFELWAREWLDGKLTRS